MDCSLFDMDLHHERAKNLFLKILILKDTITCSRHWHENKTRHLKRYDSKIVVYHSKRTLRKMR